MRFNELRWPVFFDLRANIINLHKNLYEHIYTEAKYFFLGSKDGYRILPGQEHLSTPPRINVFLLIEKGKVETPMIWTFTDIQMNESMRKITNASK